MSYKDLPGGPVIKKLPNSSGDLGSISGQGTKLPHGTDNEAHTPQLINPCATTKEYMHCNSVPHDTMKIACAATKIQHSQINKYIYFLNDKMSYK